MQRIRGAIPGRVALAGLGCRGRCAVAPGTSSVPWNGWATNSSARRPTPRSPPNCRSACPTSVTCTRSSSLTSGGRPRRAHGGRRGDASLAETLPDESADDPVARLVDQVNRRQLADAIAQLDDRDRVVVTLYYFENLTLAEIGRVLGVTESPGVPVAHPCRPAAANQAGRQRRRLTPAMNQRSTGAAGQSRWGAMSRRSAAVARTARRARLSSTIEPREQADSA